MKLNKDWTGNKRSTFSTLGASNHSEYERPERDFYATNPIAIDALHKSMEGILGEHIWENACGNGHLSKRLLELGYSVVSSDIIQRDYPCYEIDFLNDNLHRDYIEPSCDIVTNPPYKYALEFVEKSLDFIENGRYVCMFLKITFLEGQKRRKFFDEFPPKYVLVFSKRIQAAKNGDPEMFKKSSAACYAWFVWEKEWTGDPIIRWI